MGKNKLCRGIMIGAIVGGIVALFDKDARDYAKGKMTDTSTKTKYFLNHPSEAIHNVRMTVDQLNRDLAKGVESTVNALEQVETTLDKVVKK